jgi:hypothetical protein
MTVRFPHLGAARDWQPSHRLQQIAVILGVLAVSLLVVPLASQSQLRLLIGLLLATGGVFVLLRRPQLGLIALIPAALVVPFAIGTGTVSTIGAAMLLLPLLFGLWLFDQVAVQRDLTVVRHRVLIPLFLLMLAAVLAFASGQLPWFTVGGAPLRSQLGGLGLFALSAMAFGVTAHVIDDIKWLRWLTWSFLALAGVYIVGRLAPGGFPESLFLPGASGSLFWVWLMALSASQGLLNRDLSWRWRLALLGLTLATLYAALIQGYDWKSGWLPALAALATLGWLVLGRLRVWLLFAAGVAVLPVGVEVFRTLTASDQWSWLTRLEAWRILFEIVQVNPLLGLGPANYYFYTPLFPILGWSVSFNSHSQYIDLIAQVGVVGFLCYLWLFAELGLLGWRLVQRAPAGFARAYACGALAGVAGTFAAGFLGDWVIPFVYNIGFNGFRSSVIAWLFMGGLLALHRLVDVQPAQPPSADDTPLG